MYKKVKAETKITDAQVPNPLLWKSEIKAFSLLVLHNVIK